MTTKSYPASEKQIGFIARLVKERDLSGDANAQALVDEARADVMARTFAGWQARVLIDLLLTLPYNAEHAPAEATPGFYVRGDEAFKVQTNKAGTHTYALIWSGSSWDYQPGAGRRLAGLEPMTAEQAAALGLASGRCINCLKVLGGESTSAKVSALIGYGETCARRNDWAYPKGAKAQRAFIAERSAPEPVNPDSIGAGYPEETLL